VSVGSSWFLLRREAAFDQNLSYRLAHTLQDVFPDSLHVRDVGLGEADDLIVWNYARDQGLVIVSKDVDFRQRSFMYGAPPKVIGVRLGNCSTADVENLLRRYIKLIETFCADPQLAFLSLSDE
jgi:predicted nuclease of predicted toxin-antitoxin system